MASTLPPIAFIGGGNMASAIIGGLRASGLPASHFEIVEPDASARERIATQFGITPLSAASAALSRCGIIVWAVKPQVFSEATVPVKNVVDPNALHLSVAAGISSESISAWLGNNRIVRAMPNTPALVGKGMTGLFGRATVDAASKAQIETLLERTGQLLWVNEEADLDAVTAVSGSGPAYVFFFIEAMTQAGVDMGLTPEQAERLAVGTFTGASALAAASDEPPSVLRQRVTSKGGTTYAAITSMEEAGTAEGIKVAMRAAQRRAAELAVEFGKAPSASL